MVENRRFGNLLPHLILWIGIAIVAFPVYLAFIGSTHEPTIISNGQMPLTPGSVLPGKLLPHDLHRHERHDARAGRHHAAQQFHHGDDDRLRQDRDLDHLGLCDRVFPLSAPHDGVLGHLRHPDAARRGAHLSDLQGRRRPQPARYLFGADPSAGRLGDRDAAVPPVLHDGAGRAGGSLAHRRRRAVPLLQGYAAAALAHQHGGAVRDPVHLRLEPVSLAAADHHPRRHADDRHRHQEDDRDFRRADRMAARDGDRHAGDAAAGRRGDADAEAVRARAGGDGEVRWPKSHCRDVRRSTPAASRP